MGGIVPLSQRGQKPNGGEARKGLGKLGVDEGGLNKGDIIQ